MGWVYRARDIVLDRHVALKVLHISRNVDVEPKERFYREARACTKLQHPSIVMVHDTGEAAGAAYIVMELLRGTDLRRYIHESRPLSLAQKLEFLAQVCDGLAHAHQNGIVHGDLKPSNIFIHEENQSKILDFGIARLPSANQTIVGKVLGTPNYMAPEQILGRPCDNRSDLFSAAIVFFEFLVNAHPFQSSFIPRRIAEGDPDSLSKRDLLIPESLDRLLTRALKRIPDERIQTAEEFATRRREVARGLLTSFATPMDFDVASQSKERLAALPTESVLASEVDAAQWRVMEFIRLLREFDEAFALNQHDSARKTMDQMRQIAAVDGRFAETLGAYQEILDRATPGSDPIPSRVVTGDQGPAPLGSPGRTCRFCDTRNRDTAKYCEECGQGLMPRRAPSSRAGEGERLAARSRLESFFDRALAIMSRFLAPVWVLRIRRSTGGVSRWFGALKESSRLPWSGVSHLAPTQKLIARAGGAALLLVASAAMSVSLSRPVPIEKPIGVAVVQASLTDLLQNPDGNAKRLMSFQQGTRLNVLEPPKAQNQLFAYVQFVSSGKNSRPGYVRTGDLSRWDSDDPAYEWAFLRLFGPRQGDSEDQHRRVVDEMRKFARRV